MKESTSNLNFAACQLLVRFFNMNALINPVIQQHFKKALSLGILQGFKLFLAIPFCYNMFNNKHENSFLANLFTYVGAMVLRRSAELVGCGFEFHLFPFSHSSKLHNYW